jgi:hypothetical protein
MWKTNGKQYSSIFSNKKKIDTFKNHYLTFIK